MQRLELPHRLALGIALAVLLAGVAVAWRLAGDAAPQVSFAREVQPILDARCTACHPVSYPYLDLRAGRSYDDLVRVPSAINPALERVLPGRPELSDLLAHHPDPSNAELLGERERDLIRRWIEQGAERN